MVSLRESLIRRFLKKPWVVNTLLLFCSTALCLFVLETALRILRPDATFGTGAELAWFRNHPESLRNIFTVEKEFGLRPILDNDRFSQFGTTVNDYPLEKRPNVTRLLFIGDSVTGRGRIIDALKKVYGEEDFEYWNAGVESYNTAQELAFYKKYNRGIQPDHVILTFHLNDFTATPVAFVDHNGAFVVYRPGKPLNAFFRWSFRHSYTYRLILSLTLDQKQGNEEIRKEVRKSLAELKTCLDEDRIQFTVLIFPYLLPQDDWHRRWETLRSQLIEMLNELEIRYFDLYEPAQQALRSGVPVEEVPGDFSHPSQEVAAMFARNLLEQNILAKK